MRFYTAKWPRDSLPPEAQCPCVLLTQQSWDDFGKRTLFDLRFFRNPDGATHCGYVKIMRQGAYHTILPETFTELDDSYCSIGQSVEYYREFARLGSDLTAQILRPLRDIVLDPGHGRTFVDDDAFDQSLLRESEARAIWNDGHPLTGGKVSIHSKAKLKFRMNCRLPGASADHELDFQFGDGCGIPDRIMALIGKNGTGKTQVLRALAEAIVAQKPVNARIEPHRLDVIRVLAVSYSAFDEFRKPPEEERRRGSYEYCGIYDEHASLMNREEQVALVRTDTARVIKSGRTDIWQSSIRTVLGEPADRALTAAESSVDENDEDVSDPLMQLSSGELLLLVAFTRLIVSIEPQSLVLFDEPELHLHPNAVSGLMQTLSDILERFNSYAVIATHSPLVLQQIPSRYVRVLGRIGNKPLVRELALESFGENLSAVTEQIFFARGEDTYYRRVLEALLEDRTAEEVDELFENRLSLNAMALLKSLDDDKDTSLDSAGESGA